MNYQDDSRHPSESRDCPRTRLAQTDIGSVDVCDCGMWQLHIGAITLRFAPAAVSELLALLGQAVAEHAALPYHGKRGDA